MIINITFKTPDAVEMAIADAIDNEVNSKQFDTREDREIFIEEKKQECETLCEKWFKYGEYVFLEVDTETKTINVKEI